MNQDGGSGAYMAKLLASRGGKFPGRSKTGTGDSSFMGSGGFGDFRNRNQQTTDNPVVNPVDAAREAQRLKELSRTKTKFAGNTFSAPLIKRPGATLLGG